MSIQRVNNLLDRNLFLEQYNRLARMNVPKSYTEACDLYGWYNDQHELRGGYAFAVGKNMAWPKLIPADLPFFDRIDQDSCLEFNLAWADDSLRGSYFKMLNFWISSSRIIRMYQHVKQVTFAVDASHTALVETYSSMSDQILYRGPVPKYPDREVIIFACRRQRFDWMLLYCLPTCLRRLVKHTRRKWINFSEKPSNRLTSGDRKLAKKAL